MTKYAAAAVQERELPLAAGRAVLALAATVLATLTTGTIASPASAGQIGPDCVDLRAFTLSFNSGGDDLRDNSEVTVWLTTSDRGDVELQHVWGPINNWRSGSYNVS